MQKGVQQVDIVEKKHGHTNCILLGPIADNGRRQNWQMLLKREANVIWDNSACILDGYHKNPWQDKPKNCKRKQ